MLNLTNLFYETFKYLELIWVFKMTFMQQRDDLNGEYGFTGLDREGSHVIFISNKYANTAGFSGGDNVFFS